MLVEYILSSLRPHLLLDAEKTRQDYNRLGRFVFLGVGIIALLALLMIPDFDNKVIIYGYTAYCFYHFIYNKYISEGYTLYFAIANIPLGLAMIISLQWLMPSDMVSLTVFLFPIVFVFIFTYHRDSFIVGLLLLSIFITWLIADYRETPYIYSYLITTFGATILIGVVVRLSAVETEKLAHYDSLTGLMNRYYFSQSLNYLLDQTQRKKQVLSVIFIDLDGFKIINDTQGHYAGDSLLESMAKALQGISNKLDITARIGGDEFVIVMPNTTKQAAKNKLRLLTDYTKEKDIKFSAGVVEAQKNDDIESLLARADMAMYEDKRQRKIQSQENK